MKEKRLTKTNAPSLNARNACMGLLILGFAASAAADDDIIPKDPTYEEYAIIVEKDPFGPLKKKEVPPPPEQPKEPEPEPDPVPLEEYFLKGVSRFGAGWYVVLVNKKDPATEIYVEEGKKNELGIKVLGVKKDKYQISKTIVTIESQGEKQEVFYSPSFLAVPKAPTKAPSKLPLQKGSSSNQQGKRSFGRPSNTKSSTKQKR